MITFNVNIDDRLMNRMVGQIAHFFISNVLNQMITLVWTIKNFSYISVHNKTIYGEETFP